MRKKKWLGIIVVVSTIGGLLLMPTLIDTFKEVVVEESIVIDRSVSETFAFITARENVSLITDNLENIEHLSEGVLIEGSQYQRTLLVHDNPNEQLVTVVGYEPNTLFITQTELFGFEVTYSYIFTPIDSSSVRIELTKQANITGVWNILRPLLHHLLTAPDHDGKHLTILKEAIESDETIVK